MASPKFPAKFDLLGPTNEFDRIWYGNYPSGPQDVKRFRESYTELTHMLVEMVGSAK
jgi:hypothetical protein